MNEARRPQNPILSGNAARAAVAIVLSIVAIAVSVDVFALRSSGADLGIAAKIVLATIGYAARVAIMAVATLAVLSAGAVFIAQKTRARFSAPLVVMWPIAALFVHGALDLLSGPGISSKSWIGAVRMFVMTATPIAFGIFGIVGARVLARVGADGIAAHPKKVVAFRAACALGIASALFLDATYKPHLYPTAHNLAWLAVLCFGALFFVPGIVAKIGARRSRAFAIAGLLVGTAGLLPTFADPVAGDVGARRIAYRDTQFLRRALRYLSPPVTEAPVTVDRELLARLADRPKLDPSELDRLFPDRRNFNVLFVSIDAFRPDRLGKNGYARALTPNIDRFLQKSVDFDRAWTPWPTTLWAFSAIFRGMPATATDVYREFAAPGSVPDGARPETLASVMARAGRRTEAATTFFNPYWVAPFRIGFDLFNDYPRAGELPADLMTEHGLRAIDRDTKKPFFIWVHYWDPHDPYDPPGKNPFGEAVPDLYDGEVAYVDRHIGRLFQGLEARGLDRSTVVCLFSDHGEELGENGRVSTHGSALSELQVHVPCAVFIPGAQPRRIAAPMTLTELAPTVLELIGIPAPPSMVARSRLRDIVLGDAPARADIAPSLAFSELDDEGVLNGHQVALTDGSWKIVLDLDSRVYGLYDVNKDPLERRELSAAAAAEFERMKTLLAAAREMTRQAATAATAGAAESAPAAEIGSAAWLAAAKATLDLPLPPSPPWTRDVEITKKIHVLKNLVGRRPGAAVAAAAAAWTKPGLPTDLRRIAVRVLGTGGGAGDAASAASAADLTRVIKELLTDADAAVAAEAAVAAARLGLPEADAAAPRKKTFDDAAEALLELRFDMASNRSRFSEAQSLIRAGALPEKEAIELLADAVARGATEAFRDIADLCDSADGRALVLEHLLDPTSPLARAAEEVRRPIARRFLFDREYASALAGDPARSLLLQKTLSPHAVDGLLRALEKIKVGAAGADFRTDEKAASIESLTQVSEALRAEELADWGIVRSLLKKAARDIDPGVYAAQWEGLGTGAECLRDERALPGYDRPVVAFAEPLAGKLEPRQTLWIRYRLGTRGGAPAATAAYGLSAAAADPADAAKPACILFEKRPLPIALVTVATQKDQFIAVVQLPADFPVGARLRLDVVER